MMVLYSCSVSVWYWSRSGLKGSRLGSIGGGIGVSGVGIPTGSGSQVCVYYIYSRARVVAKWTNSTQKVRTFCRVFIGEYIDPLFHPLWGHKWTQ